MTETQNTSKIVVYGGTGMVGSRIVAEAQDRGHRVIAATRSGAAPDGAEGVRAELSDTDRLSELAADADVVVISVPPDRTGGPTGPMIETHRAIIAARPEGRLFVVGGAGSLQINGGGLLKDTPDFPAAYQAESDAFTEILDLYRAADGLDWVMLSPAPVIAPGERTGEFTLGGDSLVGDSVSAEDFAVAALDEIEAPVHRNQRFAVAN